MHPETSVVPSHYVLSFQCPDRIGVVCRATSVLLDAGAFISEISNYSNPISGTFHLRCVFNDSQMMVDFETFRANFEKFATEFNVNFVLRDVGIRPRVILAVSKFDHCLTAILTKWRSGSLPIDVVGIVSNHDDCRSLSEWHGVSYHYLPVTRETKLAQEASMLGIFRDQRADLLVLARYMQVLSDDMCSKLEGRVINIHHSFLPAFKGAKPYHQAYERGVKVIGATAHYVTPDLDEGPIITQEVRAIDHQVTPEQMIEIGHDTETIALSRAIRLHCEDRVQLVGHRTVIL